MSLAAVIYYIRDDAAPLGFRPTGALVVRTIDADTLDLCICDGVGGFRMPLAVKQCPPGKPALGHWSLT